MQPLTQIIPQLPNPLHQNLPPLVRLPSLPHILLNNPYQLLRLNHDIFLGEGWAVGVAAEFGEYCEELFGWSLFGDVGLDYLAEGEELGVGFEDFLVGLD